MKSTVVKTSVFFFLILLSSCAPQIAGTWNYRSVYDRNNGKQVPVVSGDSMVVRKDGSFAYALKKANRSGNGFWKLSDSNTGTYLVLRYLPNNHERSFRLDTFTRKKLVMSEGSVVFSYRRGRKNSL
ncbi:MAG: hypothetical protein RLZZ370_1943 [Bacteroidota bacterium]